MVQPERFKYNNLLVAELNRRKGEFSETSSFQSGNQR